MPDIRPPDWAAPTVDVLSATYVSWRDARTMRLGAGIAYYALFAIVPLVTLSIWFAEKLVDDEAVDDFFEKVGAGLSVSDEAIATFNETLEQGSTQNSIGLIGLGSLLFAAAVVFSALQDAFDEMWELPVMRGFRNKIQRRLKAFLIVGGGGIVIVVALAINAVSGLIRKLIPGQSTVLDRIPDLFTFLSGWVILIGGLAIMFQVLTTDRIGVVALAVGSVATALLLSVGTQLLGWYLATFASASVSGALGSVFLALLWLYYVAQMLLVGGHLIRILNDRQAETRAQAGSV